MRETLKELSNGHVGGEGEMPQQGKLLLVKPGESTLILRRHTAEGENTLPKSVF